MKYLKGIAILFANCWVVFWRSAKSITAKQDCFWTINGTVFTGVFSKIDRDDFQRDYNALVEKYKNLNK